MAAGTYLWLERDDLWGANLSALSTVTEAEGANDGRLRADLAAPDARYLVLVTGADQEAALQAAEQVGDRLDGLVRDGVIGGYDTPVRFLPSAERQNRRLAALPEPAVLQERLAGGARGFALVGQQAGAVRRRCGGGSIGRPAAAQRPRWHGDGAGGRRHADPGCPGAGT